METNHRTNNALKKALQQRKQGNLPSNFSFRMMEQVRHEAKQQQKRKDWIMLYSIIAASLLLVGLVACIFIFVLDISWAELLPQVEWKSSSTPLLAFYIYIGVLALALLAFDYWIRRKKSVH